jgi:DNA-binding NarL/FixJ family response regulator
MSPSESQRIRLLLVEDHEVVRVGLRTLFQGTEMIEVVGEAKNMATAIAEAVRLKPDVVLMDIRLPDGSGVEACREIRAICPDTRVLFLTSYSDEEAALASISGGADGFLLKDIGGEALIHAIKTVAAGQSILDPAVTRPILERMRSLTSAAGQGEELSPQEQRVLALVAEGKTNKEIAVALGLSDKTVKNYLSNVFQKLQVTRRSQAAVLFATNPKSNRK